MDETFHQRVCGRVEAEGVWGRERVCGRGWGRGCVGVGEAEGEAESVWEGVHEAEAG